MADKDKKYWMGFDLGGTKMLATIYDDQFKPLGKKKRKTRSREGEEAVQDRILETMADALEDAGLKAEDLKGIGMGSPGPLDPKKGIILDTPNLGLKNFDLKGMTRDKFKVPVVVANDVDAGTYGEYCFGAGKKARCVVGIFPGTGIGGGCVYEGDLIQGKGLSCLEIGHIPVQPEGPLCGCGQHGCLEAVASRLHIAAAAAKAAYRGEAPYLLKTAGTDLANIRSGVLAESIKQGDASVEDIVRQSAKWLGKASAMVINLLSPDVVVLGGGLVEAMPELFLEEVGEEARKRVMPSFRKTFEVKTAELGDDAVALGAAAWASHMIEKKS